jgi:Mor family transcriptional regulator
MIEHYPEAFRDMHDQILDALAGEETNEAAAAVAVHVTEWMRSNWGGRTLTRKWWKLVQGDEEAKHSATLIEVSADPVRSLRGRELRAAAWVILAGSRFLWADQGWSDICHTATLIAVTVEAEWTRAVIYLPTGKEVERAIRDAAVWRHSKGSANIDQTIATFRLSERQIYDISRRLRLDKEQREQPSLPGF